jgi:cytochrome c biogenesis protein CcmG/thiol:disulfide interchange protein DsbE
MNRLLFIVPLVAFLGVAAWLAFGLTRDPSILPSALLDRPAPDFSLPALHDGAPPLTDEDLRGEVQLVNVFASWCAPCKAEHPLLMRLAEDEGITVNGLNWKDEREDAEAFLTELGDPYKRIGFDETGRTGIDWGVYGVPETYVIDASGRIRYKHTGHLTAKDVNQTLLPLIRQLQDDPAASSTQDSVPAS